MTPCTNMRRRIVHVAMIANIDPLSALAFIRPDTTAGQLLALQVLAAEKQQLRKEHHGLS